VNVVAPCTSVALTIAAVPRDVDAVDGAGARRLVGGRLAEKPPAVLLGRPGDELAAAEPLDVCGRQERLAHLGAVAGGMAAEVLVDRGAHPRLLGRLRGPRRLNGI
jgi:hypothetical protein